jgi:hypothetical protein
MEPACHLMRWNGPRTFQTHHIIFTQPGLAWVFPNESHECYQLAIHDVSIVAPIGRIGALPYWPALHSTRHIVTPTSTVCC